MKKAIVLFALALLLCVLPACALGNADSPVLEEIVAVNTATVLLEKHVSVACYTRSFVYIEDEVTERESVKALSSAENGTILYESNAGIEMIYDGTTRYILYPNDVPCVDLCIDSSLNDYYSERIGAFRTFEFAGSEKFVSSATTSDGMLIMTYSILHGAYADATGKTYDLADDVQLLETLTLDSTTYEISSWRLDAQPAEGILLPLASGTVTYDEELLPEAYNALTASEIVRCVTLVSNPGFPDETQTEYMIADGALPNVIAPGYAVCLRAEGQEGQYEDCDFTSLPIHGDITLYLIRD